MTHLNQDRFGAMLTLGDWKICTSVPEDNLMMPTHYNMLSRPIVGRDESCDGAVKMVDSQEFLYVLFNKLDDQ
jgi:hypothetical protein